MKVIFVFAGLLEYKGRLLKQIATLQDAGHECILIHGQKEDIPPDYSAYNFKVFPFRLIRHPKKLKNYFNHMRFNFQVARKTLELCPEAIVCVELCGVLSGVIIRILRRSILFVFDCNELFMHMGMNRFKKIGWSPIHSLAFRKADIVIHAEENRLLYCKQHYASSAKHVLLENLPRVNINNLKSSSHSDCIRVVYLGALIPSRHCEEIVLAFSEIHSNTAICDLIGFGEEEYTNSLNSLISKNNITNVRILPPVSNNDMLNVLLKYDVGLAFYNNINLNQYYCAPNKVYDYIVTGLAVITNDYPGLLSVIQENNVGVCLSDVTSESIRLALEKIARERTGQNITSEIKNRYIWSNQEETYLSIFLHKKSSTAELKGNK